MNLVFVALFEQSPMPDRAVDRLGTDPGGAFPAALQAAAAGPGVLERSQATQVRVATGDDAPALDRLAALTGRLVPWTS